MQDSQFIYCFGINYMPIDGIGSHPKDLLL